MKNKNYKRSLVFLGILTMVSPNVLIHGMHLQLNDIVNGLITGLGLGMLIVALAATKMKLYCSK